ncbi:MAG: ParB N-terminal domain-containing protein [Chloroflexota bacterium]
MTNAPTPNLQIIPVNAPQPHEEHDSQRSEPLIETIRSAHYVTNPPIVTHTGDDMYVILDGANRCHTFAALGFPYILVQVVSYFSEQVRLQTWNHVISRWDANTFLEQVEALPDVEMTEGMDKHAIAHISLPDGTIYALNAPVDSVHQRNAALRDFVRIYQKNAALNRTPLNESAEVWKLYPEADALVFFPGYEPRDIVEAARYKSYLPPGISRHIVQGRALQLNYPIEHLRDTSESLEAKNAHLRTWISEKLMNREVR